MDLYITQKSYYFVHQHFINIFLRENSHVVYVKETKRGILKKYIEIIANFGLLNVIRASIMEFVYYIRLSTKTKKIITINTSDHNLNTFLEEKIKSKLYDQIFSIGCPCIIDATLQKRYNINIYNLHGGIIPFQKGRFSPIKAIKKKDLFLGASLYLISDIFDEGSLISQDYFQINNKFIMENYHRVLKLSADLLENYLSGEVKDLPIDVYESLK